VRTMKSADANMGDTHFSVAAIKGRPMQ